MVYYLVKIAITTVLIVAISEIAKRSSFFGALLASVPLVSILAMIWLYIDTKDTTKVIDLSNSVFWLVLLLLKQGLSFYISMIIAVGVTILCYWLMIVILNHLGIRL
ncbi:MAG: hypothetical protein AMJ53_13990 [Gammaproteobacteria bacterium SG8_11]|nr:MAG: hypothetical protein AMJ53_13990 [Gammaproteobacteria bacterium SG8_11]